MTWFPHTLRARRGQSQPLIQLTVSRIAYLCTSHCIERDFTIQRILWWFANYSGLGQRVGRRLGLGPLYNLDRLTDREEASVMKFNHAHTARCIKCRTTKLPPALYHGFDRFHQIRNPLIAFHGNGYLVVDQRIGYQQTFGTQEHTIAATTATSQQETYVHSYYLHQIVKGDLMSRARPGHEFAAAPI